MRGHGAVDIDERATEWKKQGWKGRFEAEEPKLGKRRPKKVRTASNPPHYSGPERRMSTTPYTGIERRRAA
jgi:hypothetical protein